MEKIQGLIDYLQSKTPIKLRKGDIYYTMTSSFDVEEAGEEKEEEALEEMEGSFSLEYGGIQEYITIDFRSYLTPARIGKIVDNAEQSKSCYLVVSDYISPTVQNEFRELKISFMEIGGSIYVRGKSIFVDIRKSKSNRSNIKSKSDKLSKKGLLLVKWILENDILDRTYREVSMEVGVSQGVIATTYKTLTDKGYLIKENRTYMKNTNKNLLKFYLSHFKKQ